MQQLFVERKRDAELQRNFDESDLAVVGEVFRLLQLVGGAQQVREPVRGGVGNSRRLVTNVYRSNELSVLTCVLRILHTG